MTIVTCSCHYYVLLCNQSLQDALVKVDAAVMLGEVFEQDSATQVAVDTYMDAWESTEEVLGPDNPQRFQVCDQVVEDPHLLTFILVFL